MVWSDKFRTDSIALDLKFVAVAVALDAIASTDIVNVSEEGILQGIAGLIITNTGGSITANLEVTIDGVVVRSIDLYTASTRWDRAGVAIYGVIWIPLSYDLVTGIKF